MLSQEEQISRLKHENAWACQRIEQLSLNVDYLRALVNTLTAENRALQDGQKYSESSHFAELTGPWRLLSGMSLL